MVCMLTGLCVAQAVSLPMSLARSDPAPVCRPDCSYPKSCCDNGKCVEPSCKSHEECKPYPEQKYCNPASRKCEKPECTTDKECTVGKKTSCQQYKCVKPTPPPPTSDKEKAKLACQNYVNSKNAASNSNSGDATGGGECEFTRSRSRTLAQCLASAAPCTARLQSFIILAAVSHALPASAESCMHTYV